MHVVHPMAVNAALVGVTEHRAQVTGLAACGGMLANQRKARQVVVEANVLQPGHLAMALIAAFSLLTLVRVVLLVAAVTGAFYLLGFCAERVTCLAGEIVVCAVEREIGIGAVIELGVRPAPDDMATLALFAVQTVVHVVVTVAAIAIPDLVLAIGYAVIGRMAVVAGDSAMAAFERVVRVAFVIEGAFIPGFFLVTALAFWTEAVAMYVADFVAADASFGSVLVFATDVAGIAVDPLM